MSIELRPRAQRRAKITALGTYVPPRLLTNADLEKMVDTSDDWIMERTGHPRAPYCRARVLTTSDLAMEAARSCLANRGIMATDVEVIIVAHGDAGHAFSRDGLPGAGQVGAHGAWGFDLSAACSGFLYALQMGRKLVETGAHKKVMVIGADMMSSIIDYTDRATCVIFGDGAGAVLLEPCGGRFRA